MRTLFTFTFRAGAFANCEVTMMYWEIGQHINSVLLGGIRAEYGKQIVATLSQQLSWSHFIELLPIKLEDARMYYANEAVKYHLDVANCANS